MFWNNFCCLWLKNLSPVPLDVRQQGHQHHQQQQHRHQHHHWHHQQQQHQQHQQQHINTDTYTNISIPVKYLLLRGGGIILSKDIAKQKHRQKQKVTPRCCQLILIPYNYNWTGSSRLSCLATVLTLSKLLRNKSRDWTINAKSGFGLTSTIVSYS